MGFAEDHESFVIKISYIKSYRSCILGMRTFHLSDQVFMIIKNATIYFTTILKLDVLSISFELEIPSRDKVL